MLWLIPWNFLGIMEKWEVEFSTTWEFRQGNPFSSFMWSISWIYYWSKVLSQTSFLALNSYIESFTIPNLWRLWWERTWWKYLVCCKFTHTLWCWLIDSLSVANWAKEEYTVICCGQPPKVQWRSAVELCRWMNEYLSFNGIFGRSWLIMKSEKVWDHNF